MGNTHDAQKVLSYLEKESVGILGTLDEKLEFVRLRVMYYGVDSEFGFYLMSTKGSPKIKQIINSHSISFLVFGLEDPYDNSWEIEVDGYAEILKKEKEIYYALEKLKERNPFADVAVESGITAQFDLIKLIPKIIRFRIYGEALRGDPPTILEL